jgi:hypothetical protein
VDVIVEDEDDVEVEEDDVEVEVEVIVVDRSMLLPYYKNKLLCKN